MMLNFGSPEISPSSSLRAFLVTVASVVVVSLPGCTPEGALGGACYGNGTCNTGLFCNAESVCVEAEVGSRNGACYGNNTCDTGLDCRAGICIDPNNPDPGVSPEGTPSTPQPGTPEPSEPGQTPETPNPGTPVPDVEPDVNVGPPINIPGAEDAVVADNPTAPLGEGGTDLGWPTAPLMEGVRVAPNLSSAKILVPAVDGAQDYRVFKLEPGMDLTVQSGTERVEGGTLFCAGYRQRNDAWSGSRELLTVIEVADVTSSGRYVVEALDRGCPFPGVRGPEHVEVTPINDEINFSERHAFTVYTDAEIATAYGSVVINGQRPRQAQGFV